MKNLPTKILIRRIPPKLTEEKFLEMINPIPAYDYFRFCAPNPNIDLQSFCRAYINFCDPQDVFQFSERFNDYVFVDEEGTESNAIVEYAVFQGTSIVPTSGLATAKPNPKRADKRQGTIDDDPDYKAFLQSLANASISSTDPTTAFPPKDVDKKQTPWEAMLETIKLREENAEVQKTTPLVSYINQRLERRKRNAAEDAKAASGQKGHAKSGVFRSSAKSRAQMASRRISEFGRQRADSRSSPMTASVGKDDSPKPESIRKLSEGQTGNPSNNGAKRNIDSNRAPDKLVVHRSARKNKRRTASEKDDAKCESGLNETTWISAKQFEEDTEKREQTKSRSVRGDKANTFSGSQSTVIARSLKSDRDSSGNCIEQRSVDSGEGGIVETNTKSVGRPWASGNTGQRQQNSAGGGRYGQEIYDDERGFPEPMSRGGRSCNSRFTTSRSRRGAGRYPADYSQTYSPRYEQAQFGDNDDPDSQQRDQLSSRGGGPSSNRGFRSRGGGPRSSFTSSLRGSAGRGVYRS